KEVTHEVREFSKPYLVHAKVPLLGHHTSGVRKEFYRSEEDLARHSENDPFFKLKKKLIQKGFSETDLDEIEVTVTEAIAQQFDKAVLSPEPDTATIQHHIFAPTPVKEEEGI